MNLIDVIKAGEGLSEVIEPTGTFYPLVPFIILFLIGIGIISSFLAGISVEPKHLLLGIISSLLAVVIFVGFQVYAQDKREEAEQKNRAIEQQLTDWKENLAHPYIKEQEHVKQELQQVVLNSGKFDPGYLSLTLVFSDKHNNNLLTTESDVYEIDNSLPAGAEPYMTYYRLLDNLGNGINRGRYFKVIHLPQNFKFAN